jgi:hypothetical protein
MLPLISIRNSRFFTPSSLVLLKQSLRVKQLTPISSYHHFLRKEDETAKRKTGLGSSKHLAYNQQDLFRAIHSSSALFFRNSNLLGQKLENEQQKTEEKKIERKEVTLDALEEGQKLGLFAKFKKMGKDYWYVLIPVHVVTSSVWLGTFYYASTRFVSNGWLRISSSARFSFQWR